MVLLLCSMCAVCFAKLEQPTDDRWVIVGGVEGEFDIWLDVNTIVWKQSGEAGHSGHKAARVWTQLLNHKDSIKSLFCYEFDIDCSSNRYLSWLQIDKKGMVVMEDNSAAIQSKPITPGSSFESMFYVLVLLDDARNDKEKYDRYIRMMKLDTIKYKNSLKS